jgi:hypothetical protein
MSKEAESLVYGLICGLFFMGFGGILIGPYILPGLIFIGLGIIGLVAVRQYKKWVKDE